MNKLAILLLLTLPAWANSFGPTLALQQPAGLAPGYLNVSNVPLTGTPLLAPTLITPYLTGNYLGFVSLFDNASGRLDAQLTIGGVVYSTGALLNNVSSSIESFVLPRTFYHPTAATLSLCLNGECEEHRFMFADPVPEPGTWLLVGTGCVFCFRRWYERI
jgi:hypothetical protein